MSTITKSLLFTISFFVVTSAFAMDESTLAEGKGTGNLHSLPSVHLVGDRSTLGVTGPPGTNFLQVQAIGPTGGSGSGYLLCSSDVMENLFGKTEDPLGEMRNDPAIQNFNRETVNINVDSLLLQPLLKQKDILLQGNKLDLSNRNFQGDTFNFLWGAGIDLSCIRRLNVACSAGKGNEYDANKFLEQLFKNSKTLRSLEFLDIGNSNVTLPTIELWRSRSLFDGPLIRSMENISEGSSWKVAYLYLNNVRTTPITQANSTDQRNAQRSDQRTFSIVYVEQGYERGEAHLEVVFK
jgi:hypothetical protein